MPSVTAPTNDHLVVALLPPESAQHLADLLGRPLTAVRSFVELATKTRRTPELIIFDPLVLTSNDEAGLVDLIRRHPWAPLLAYVQLFPQSLIAIARLSSRFAFRVLIHPLQNGVDPKWEILGRTVSRTLAHEVLAFFEPALAKLSVPVANAIGDLFFRPHRYFTAGDIAVSANLSTRELYRECEVLRPSTPKKLFVAAKVLHVYGYLTQTDLSLTRVSTRLGYSDVRPLSQHLTQSLGYTATQLRNERYPTEIVRGLLEWLVKPADR